jgi:hypothetical protein
MAQLISPGDTCPPGYAGLPSIFEFTNWDGYWVPYNCGQAAACTFLAYLGILAPAAAEAGKIMRLIEKTHPPDNMRGYFGTSRRRVERILRRHGVRISEVDDEDALRRSLDAGKPVIVMVAVPGLRVWRWNMPMGHWMVAYGYDSEHIYLTNRGRMTWTEFRRGWNGLVPRLVNMRQRGLVAE